MSLQSTPSSAAYRARYLKLKSVLHDRATGLPAVAVLLEQLRTQLDDRRALGVLHLSIENLPLVESLYGWQVLDRVLARIAFELRESCGEELPGDSLLAINAVAGDSFAVFILQQVDGREIDGAFLRSTATVLRERIQSSLRSDDFAGLGPELRVRIGHAQLSRNPFYRFERRVYAALQEAEEWEEKQRERRVRGLDQDLERIIREESLETVFQPIVDLRSRAVLGYEALTRGPVNTRFAAPAEMFRAAAERGVAADLDRVCREAAMRSVCNLAAPGKVFLNALPIGLADDPAQQTALLEALREMALAPRDLVLEFSEREVERDPEGFSARLNILKDRGFSIALDDIGTGYASQPILEAVRPDYLKLDGSLVNDIEQNLIKQELIVSLIRISAQIGASVIAEGVETEAAASALLSSGAQFGQGFLFAHPAAPELFVAPSHPEQEH